MELEQDSKISDETKTNFSVFEESLNTKLTQENVEYFNGGSARLSDGKINMDLRDSVHIIAKDRQLPMYLQDDIEEVLGIAYLDKLPGVDNKGVQTYISGVRTMSNFLCANDLTHSAAIINPTIRQKDPSSSFSYASELSVTRSHLKNVHSNYQRLKERFHKLHEDYYKLIRVAGELTMALENSVRGTPVDLPSTLKSCMNVYPDLFKQNVRDDFTETKSLKSEIELQHHDLTEPKRPILGIVPISPKLFDYKKIKLHLINGNVKTKLLLLQALRWKITLSQPAERDEAIHEYTSSDLLGLHGQIASDSGKSILPYLFLPLDVVLPHPLQQSAARLLNTLASFRCGRDYLSIGPTVLNVVIQCLDTAKAETVDAFTCDMILAMLQKMSLRRQQRLYMIGMGLVEWLIYHLKAEHQKIGTYRLEYSTALLMNLSLDREAQVRAATMSTLVLSTLTELLSSAHLPAIPYVIGALNSFLTNQTINAEAKKLDLDSVLEYHRRRNSGEIRRNLDHILRRSYAKVIEDNIVVADDDNEELEVLENELDELDPVKVHSGELFGEALLATCYSISPSVHPKSSLDDSNKYSSLKSSESSDSKPIKNQPNEDTSNVIEDSLQEMPTRLTPSKTKLEKNNTSPLKIIRKPDDFVENHEQILPKMIDRSTGSAENLDIRSDSSGSWISGNNSLSATSLHSHKTPKERRRITVNSIPIVAAAYENSAEAEDNASSIASLIAESEQTNEVQRANVHEKSHKQEIEEEAFVSKPRIMRTPPNSAAMRTFTPQGIEKIDELIIE